MTHTLPSAVRPIDHVHCNEIDFEEHHSLLSGLRNTKVFELGVVTVRAGQNAANALVMLIETMEGKFAAVNAI